MAVAAIGAVEMDVVVVVVATVVVVMVLAMIVVLSVTDVVGVIVAVPVTVVVVVYLEVLAVLTTKVVIISVEIGPSSSRVCVIVDAMQLQRVGSKIGSFVYVSVLEGAKIPVAVVLCHGS